MVRAFTGLPRQTHRTLIAGAKLEAEVALITLLAGPMVEEHFRAAAVGEERWFDWSARLEDEENCEIEDSDTARALAIAEEELCRGWRATVASMDDAVAHIAEKLDGDGRYLRSVVAAADVLETRLRLDHDEAVAVIRAAW